MSEQNSTESSIVWVELRLLVPETDPQKLEPLDRAVLGVAPGGFVMEGSDAPPGEVAPPDEGWVRYRVYCGEQELAPVKFRMEAALAAYEGAYIETAELPADWRNRWKKYFKPLEVTDRLVITPPWEQVEVRPGRHIMVVEPGLAFGTGQHETTWLCLEAIDDLAAKGELPARLLDVGCGTGILAVAAVFFGAQHVYGIDVDFQAVRASDENAEINGVAEHCQFAAEPITRVEGTYPLVVANIMAHILIAMKTPLSARVSAGGRLMLSGVLRRQAAEVIAAFETEGLRHLQTYSRGEWTRIDFVKSNE